MIYLFCGDDIKNKRKNYEEFISSIPKGLETFFINKNDFDKNHFENLYSSSGLFFNKCLVVLDNIFERDENLEFILNKLEYISKSGNDFVFLDGVLNKLSLDEFKKAKAEINVFELPKEKKEKFDNFLVANAFARKDKVLLWVYFRQAVNRGVIMEELIGVLFWKIKDMILRRDFSKFTEKELQNFITKISYLLPKARKEGDDAEAMFEKFLLEAF